MSTIKIKRSGVSAQTPSASDLQHGELALNYADGKLYFKDANDAIAEIGAGSSGSGGGLDSAAVTVLVDSDYVAARAPSGETYSIDEAGRANTDDWIRFGANGANNQDRVYMKSTNSTESWRGSTGYGGFQFDGSNTNQAFVMQNGDHGAQLIGYRYVTGGDEGLVLEGKSGQASKSTIYLDTNSKTAIKITDGSVELPSIPTSDPNNTNEIWSDNGVLVMSGSTAPSGGGGLDSAGVLTVFDHETTIKLGDNSTASGTYTVSIGVSSSANSSEATAVGPYASATGIFSVALGRSATTSYADAIAIGRSATSSQADTIAMGTSAVASGSQSVAIGNATDATAQSSIALGNSAQSLGGYSIAIGQSADTNTNSYGVAIGSSTEVTGAQGIAIGQSATTTASSVSIGTNSSVTTGTNTTAVGPFAGATGSNALALGRGAKANADNTIALAATGSNSTVSSQYGIDIRTSDAGSLTYSTDSDWVFGASVNVNGGVNASGDITAFSTAVSSDPRLKENVEMLDDAVSKVQQLNGVSWDWVRGGKSAGVISTDVQAVMPEAVIPSKLFGEDTEYDTVNYNALIGLLVEAVKDLQSQIDELKAGE